MRTSSLVSTGGNMDIRKEEDVRANQDQDQRPTLLNNVWFWFWQLSSWLGYTLISLIYIPWALAWHAILAGLAIPFAPVLCSRAGRKVFIYAYVITVMMPGKYLWFNMFIHTKRRGKVWDYEMGKPRAIPLETRRRLSHDAQLEGKNPQTASTLMTRIPAEIRMQIYKEIFVGSSSHLHVVVRRCQHSRSKTKPPAIKVRGYLCSREHGEQKFAKCGCMIGSHAHHDPPHASEVELPLQYGNGRIAILQTCKQIYGESIDLMYSAPTFCFNNLEQPPFFIRSSLPDRLAHIQNIQLCWKQCTMSPPSNSGSSLAKYMHKIGQCAFCNLTHWLQLIRKHMTGLRKIEAFLYLDKKMPVPRIGQSWVADMLALQRGPQGLRKMRLKVFCNQEETLEVENDYKKAVKKFMKELQKEMKKNAGIQDAPKPVSGEGKVSDLTTETQESLDDSAVIGPVITFRSESDDHD